MKYGQYKFNRGKYSTADLEEGASTVSVTSGIANAIAVRVRTSGALSAGVTVVTTVANLTSVGASAITATSTSSCASEKISLGSATATVASSTTAVGERIHLANATDSYGIYGISDIDADSELIMLASASMASASSVSNPRGGFKHTADVNDITSSSAIVSSGRKKWELIGEGSETWTLIAA